MKNLGENSKCDRSGPTHRCNRTVYSRSGAAQLAATGLLSLSNSRYRKVTRVRERTVYVSFRSEHSRCGATTLLLRDWVRVNLFGAGSQHIPDLEQYPYHMLVNSFVRLNNPDLRQHRCYGTVYGSIRFIMQYYDFCFFSALPSSLSTWHRVHL